MSRIGKKPIALPKGVTAQVSEGAVEVKGPKGSLRQMLPPGILFELADGLRLSAVALSPYLPETAASILAALGQSTDVAWERVAYGQTAAASGIEAAPPLFPRIDAPAVA